MIVQKLANQRSNNQSSDILIQNSQFDFRSLQTKTCPNEQQQIDEGKKSKKNMTPLRTSLGRAFSQKQSF